MIYESELYHHGVKGMKWGVRKKKVVETTNSDKVREYRDEMQRRKENAKKAQAEYNQAKKSYNTERSKMNETFLRKQLTIEKLGKRYGTTKNISRYMNDGDSISSARIKAYAQAGASIVGGIAFAKFMRRRVSS